MTCPDCGEKVVEAVGSHGDGRVIRLGSRVRIIDGHGTFLVGEHDNSYVDGVLWKRDDDWKPRRNGVVSSFSADSVAIDRGKDRLGRPRIAYAPFECVETLR